MFYEGMPSLMIGATLNGPYIRMDDLGRSALGVPGNVPKIWDRVRASVGDWRDGIESRLTKKGGKTPEAVRRREAMQRRQKVRQRKEASGPIGQLGLTLPATTFFMPAVVSAYDSVANQDDVLLVPMRGSKNTAGAYQPHKIIEKLRAALGVQTVLADYQLRALLRDGNKATEILDDSLRKAVAHTREIGVKNLPTLTEFNTVGQVKRWADTKFPEAPARRVQSHATDIEKLQRPVKLLSAALSHAERVVAAYHRLESESDGLDASALEKCIQDSPHAGLSLVDLCDIARFGDINPISLWHISHDRAAIFEVARIIGRVHAGAHTVVLPHLQPIFLALVGASEAQHGQGNDDQPVVDALEDKIRSLARSMAELLEPANMTQILANAFGTGQKLVIERHTRKVSLQPLDGDESETDLGRIYNPLKPRGFMVSIVPRKPEQ